MTDTTYYSNGTNNRLLGWFFLLLVFSLTEGLISTQETVLSVFILKSDAVSPQRTDK